MRIIEANSQKLNLGRQGENRAVQVRFPFVTAWRQTYGTGGTFQLLVQRPGEFASYGVPVRIAEGRVLWDVTDTDTASAGRGKAELLYVVGNARVKSLVWETVITESLSDPSPTPPDPWTSWMDDILSSGSTAIAARDAAASAAEDAEAWAVGKRSGTDVPSTDDAYKNHAKYYAGQAGGSVSLAAEYAAQARTSAETSEAWAVGTRGGEDVPSGDAAYNHSAKFYADRASDDQIRAGGYAAESAVRRDESEAWARGTAGGVEVRADDAQYHNNARYYAEAAAGSASAAAASAVSAAEAASSLTDYSELSRRVLAAFPKETVSGNPAVITDGADGLPAAELTVRIDGTQDGSGTPSPDNLRPLNGFDRVSVRVYDAEGTMQEMHLNAFGTIGTVYRGSMNLTTGVLTVNWALLTFTGTESWNKPFSGENNYCFRHVISNTAANAGMNYRACSHYPNASVTSGTSEKGYYVYNSGTSVYVQFRPANLPYTATAADWKAYLAAQYEAGTPVQAAFAYAEPKTFQLTPAEITTVLGTNSIVANSGEVTVTYRADPTLLYETLQTALSAAGVSG